VDFAIERFFGNHFTENNVEEEDDKQRDYESNSVCNIHAQPKGGQRGDR
jgi:hypothetical protein